MDYVTLTIAIVGGAIALILSIKAFGIFRKLFSKDRDLKAEVTDYSKTMAMTSEETGEYRSVNGFMVKLNQEKQGNFMPGRNGYEVARNNGNLRSVIFRDANGLQKLLDEKAGTGEFVASNKEKINFGTVIGQYMDPETKGKMETTVGVIHYTAEGAYIVPARPNTRR